MVFMTFGMDGTSLETITVLLPFSALVNNNMPADMKTALYLYSLTPTVRSVVFPEAAFFFSAPHSRDVYDFVLACYENN
jgi:hypothetical protein